MAEVTIKVGGRDFAVSCQDGEEDFLQTAAAMLDVEAQSLSSQIGRMPESRMLLMSGLLLADKTAAMEDRVREAEGKSAELQSQLDAIAAQGAPEPERIEVPVIPHTVTDAMAELAARAEALAADVEAKAS